jgi:hypothetical protein
MNCILFSRYEGFEEGAKRICAEAILQRKSCTVIEIRDLVDSIKRQALVAAGSHIYFLTNDKFIPFYSEFLKSLGVEIINERFLSGDASKFILQEKLRLSGIVVPKSLWIPEQSMTDSINTLRFPIFIKSQKQADFVKYVEGIDELKKQIKIVPCIGELYFEEAVESEAMELKKFYCVKGSTVVDSEGIPEWLDTVFRHISQSLGLQVFSADMFIDWSKKEYYCIDVNPASAFFNSNEARTIFVRECLI